MHVYRPGQAPISLVRPRYRIRIGRLDKPPMGSQSGVVRQPTRMRNANVDPDRVAGAESESLLVFGGHLEAACKGLPVAQLNGRICSNSRRRRRQAADQQQYVSKSQHRSLRGQGRCRATRKVRMASAPLGAPYYGRKWSPHYGRKWSLRRPVLGVALSGSHCQRRRCRPWDGRQKRVLQPRTSGLAKVVWGVSDDAKRLCSGRHGV